MNSDSFQKLFGQRIRELRKLNGLTQLELSKETHLTLNTISQIECGKVSPKLDTLFKLSLSLDVNLEDLLYFPNYIPRDKNIRKDIEQISRRLMMTDKEFIQIVLQIINHLFKIRNKK